MYKKYVIGLASVYLSLFIVLVILGIWLEPFEGDLTRVGGFSSNQYSWTKSQEAFVNLNYTQAASIEDYDKHFDIIIYGDSFTASHERPDRCFTSSFVHYLSLYGKSVITFNLNKFQLEEILNSPAYVASPPEFFILERVERGMLELANLTLNSSPERALKDVQVNFVSKENKRNFEENSIKKVKRASYKKGPDFDLACNLLKNKAFSRQVVQKKLSREDLFSNKVASKVLLKGNDYALRGYTEGRHKANVEKVQKFISNVNQLVTSSSKTTRFFAFIVPDKSSIYKRWIEGLDSTYSLCEDLCRHGENALPLYQHLEQAVDRGEQDIYLPDDTHWGSEGCKVAASVLSESMNIKSSLHKWAKVSRSKKDD